ncbi:MAG TPA: porin, partial [Candidatus Methylomirabilis sp.]|nr:porin [Candidatus Methylomirabilis sp.]
EYRVRFYTGVGVQFVNTSGSNPRGAQLRVRPLFDVKDDNGNIQGLLRLEIGDIEFGNGGGAIGVTNAGAGGNITPGGARVGNGSGGSGGNDGVNVETKWAWIDAAFPFGIPLRARAGLQPWYLPKGLIIDDDTVGVRLYGSVKPVSYDVAWYRPNGGPNTAAALGSGQAGQAVTSNVFDNNYDFYQAKVDVAIAEFFNPGIYYIFARNAAFGTAPGGGTTVPYNNSQDSNFIGFTATGKVGIVGYDFDFVYGSQEGGPSGNYPTAVATVDVAGFAVDAAVHVPIGPVTLNLAGSYATGDKRDGGDSEAFPYIAPSWNGPGGLFHMIGSGGPFDQVEYTQDAPTNLWTVGLTADYRPVKQLLLTAGAAYAGFAKNSGNCAVAPLNPNPCFGPAYPVLAGKSTLGAEFFLTAYWDIWTGFKLQGDIGFLVPPTGKTAQEYVLQMLYSF